MYAICKRVVNFDLCKGVDSPTVQNSPKFRVESLFGKALRTSSQDFRIEAILNAFEGRYSLLKGVGFRIVIQQAAAILDDFHCAAARDGNHRLAACERFHHGDAEIFFTRHYKSG